MKKTALRRGMLGFTALAIGSLVAITAGTQGGAAQAAVTTHNASSSHEASGKKVYTIKWSSSNAEGNPQVTMAEEFKKLIEKSSKGQVKVTIYLNSVLDSTAQQPADVGKNVIQMDSNNVSALAAFVPKYNFMQLPFVFNSPTQVAKGFASAPVKALNKELEKKSNIKVLGWSELGWVQIANTKHAVVTPADLNGIKIRVIPGSDPLTQSFKLLGAQPVPLSFNETYSAVQAGTVDANEEPLNIFDTDKELELYKYLTKIDFQYNPGPVLINAPLFNSMPKSLQKQVQAAADTAIADNLKQVDTEDAKLLKSFKETAGNHVTVLTTKQRQAFVDKVAPYLKQSVSTYGAELFKAFGIDPKKL